MNTEEKIEVMQAWVDGETIQVKDCLDVEWRDSDPGWNWVDYDYRVKPRPFEMVAWVDDNGFVREYDIRQDADYRRWPSSWRLLKLREVG